MNIVCVQFDIAWQSPEQNIRQVRQLLEAQSIPPDSLIVLPEMFATGFTMDPREATRQSEQVHAFCGELAATLDAYVLAGLATMAPSGPRARNQAVLFDPTGKVLLRQDKLHPFSPSGEDKHFQPGREVHAVRVGGMCLATLICYDLRFPETFRTAALSDEAELYVVIANWPAARAEHWTTLLRARAIENQAFVVGVNRIGSDPNQTYAGGSLVIGPDGQVLWNGGERLGAVQVVIDPRRQSRLREEFPVLADARDFAWVRKS
ncbi:MAG: nitrilase-related carbon-nitrogen hydrolase [Phycisphaerae bacterium]